MNWFTRSSANRYESIPRTPSLGAMVAARDPWDLNFPLLQWSPGDYHTLRQAYAGTVILGEIGAAKSTASGAVKLIKLLEIGAGGLVGCVKPGMADDIRAYAEMTGRLASVIFVQAGGKWRCNLMRYVLKKPGIKGSRVEALVSLLMTIVESTERSEQGKSQGGDVFWTRSLRALLRNGIEICIAGRNDITMALLDEVISSAPRDQAEVHNADWQKKSTCYRIIEEAEAKAESRTEREQKDCEQAFRYFLSDLPGMPSDTKGSILATYRSMADVLLRGHVADLFDGDTTFLPELSHEGALIVLDLPTKIYGQAGISVQAAFTHVWQMAAEQRDVKANPRPLVWFLDESAALINNYTVEFLQTARSANVASILIAQNIPGMVAGLGGGDAGRARVDAILGNTGTKIFHANGDVTTNKMASEMINDAVQNRTNYHAGRNGEGQGSGGGGETVGKKVLASEFTTLRKGGAPDFISEAIVYQTGASFRANGGEPWLRTAFRQIIPGVTVKPGKRS
jgi:hypothetical protein